jgi:hypothetical protein
MTEEPTRGPGRPSDYTPEIAETICTRLASGESLREICEDDAMPVRSTVYLWLMQRQEFSDQYARARELQAETFVDEIVEIADDGRNDWMLRKFGNDERWVENGEAMRRSQIRIDARKWHASKLASKKYGDKITQEHTGANGAALVPVINVSLSKP